MSKASYTFYQVDAFTHLLFGGNQAGVCPLTEWLPDDIMQKIAAENNLAETAFFVKENDTYLIRWFTPMCEVDLCGHATLASAYILFNHEGERGNRIEFFSPRSGQLIVTKNEDELVMNFPTDILELIEHTQQFQGLFQEPPIKFYKGKTDYLFIFKNEESIQNLQPNMTAIAKLDARGIITSAVGNEVDFVSRFFAPQSGIPEDPVTGSAHTTLTPYWAKELNKTEMIAIQLSERRGYLNCKYLNERVEIGGQCKLYMKGNFYIE